jgi:protein O-GlcNAc transferase
MAQPTIQQTFDLAVRHHLAGRMKESEQLCRQVLASQPKHPEALHLLGAIAYRVGRYDAALDLIRQAVALRPNRVSAHSNLGSIYKSKGQIIEAIAAYRQAVALDPDDATIDSNLVYTLHFSPTCDAQTLAEEHRRWNRRHAQPLRKFIQPHSNDRNPDRRLRIGYVSPDFRDHVIGRNLLPLFQHHDRRQSEITCYSHVPRPDATTSQFQKMADHWHNIASLSDEQLAKQIREDQIDILVDLALHMGKNRLLVFARKPAPVQATFAGYPGSTGLETIDYRLTDPYLDPPGLNDQFYSEKSFRLPHTFWCYDPLGAEVSVNAPPAQSLGHITFGCLSNFCKVNDPVLQLWAQVLKSVDRSRMLILAPEGSHRQRLTDLLHRDGIAPDRIEFVTQRPRIPYLELYHRIDIGLDTFPYNGHSTSLDSFWMGVPVIIFVGKTVVGRAGVSQLTNLGLTELIANTPQEYVRLATELAGDLPRLAELRRTLRPRMQASPLMDAPLFARDIEAAYRRMWRIWCGQSGNSGLQSPSE